MKNQLTNIIEIAQIQNDLVKLGTENGNLAKEMNSLAQKGKSNSPEYKGLEMMYKSNQRVIAEYETKIKNFNQNAQPTSVKTESPTTSSPTESPTTSSPTEKPSTEQTVIPETEQTVTDQTNSGIESPINGSGYYDAYIQYQKEAQQAQWNREDKIREHVEEREDNAWQRSVADMLKAGVNPNLVNAQPAASGGGITLSTGLDNSVLTSAMGQESDIYATNIEAETAKLDRDLQMKLQMINVELEKYLAEYNGNVELTLQALEQNHQELLLEIEHNYAKELADIEQRNAKELQKIDNDFNAKQNTKNRWTTLISSLAGLFSFNTIKKVK